MRFLKAKGFTISELLVVFTVVLLLTGLLYPLIRHTTVRTNKSRCRNNLRNIGVALYIYASENNGQFPDSLNVLYENQYLSDESLLNCPSSPDKATPEGPDYVYASGLSVLSDSEKVLLKDRKNNHPNAKNVLLVNGRVVTKKSK